MPLVSMNEVLPKAQKEGYGVGAFNVEKRTIWLFPVTPPTQIRRKQRNLQYGQVSTHWRLG